MIRSPKTKALILSALRWFLLLPIPALWYYFDARGDLEFFENKTLDWRFQVRGELESPVNVVYVNLDTLSLSSIGGWPWSRSIFARVTSALLNEARVKVVAYDVVFSDQGLSESVDRRKLVFGNAEFGNFLRKEPAPAVVLASSYAGQNFLDVNGERRERMLPLVATDSRPLEKIEPPEIPSLETSPDRAKPRPWTPPVAIGLIDTLYNGTRTVPMWAPNNTKITYHHMAAELARLYWGLPRGAIKVARDSLDFVRSDGSLQASVPLRDQQLVDVNWFTQWGSPQVARESFAEVYEYADMLTSKDEAEKKAAKEYFSQAYFRDAVVLVGPTDPLFQDLAPTPLDNDPVPKVSVHANLLKTIVSGLYLDRPSRLTVFGLVMGVAFVVTVLSISGGARAVVAKFIAALSLLAYVAVAFHLFREQHLVLPLVAPVGAALTMSFGALLWQVIDEQKARGRIKGMFSAYLAPTVVNSLIDSGREPELGGHEAEITAYFSDIQSFSSFSEKMTPARLVELMNEYLTVCTDIVQEEGGTLDKYIGDAVVAMFGAPIPLPDHAHRAVVSTIRVQKGIEELRRKWRSEGEAWPLVVHNLRARLGLNSGAAIIGNMGSRTRFSYTMMGDNVNLAARMESGAKSLGVYTMITESTRLACEKHSGDAIVFRFLDKLVVKGRSLPVPVHEVVGLKADLPPQTLECLGIHGEAVQRYLAQDWDGAIRTFERSAALEPNQPSKAAAIESNPSLIMIERCHYMKEHPPAANWDGVYVMKEK